MAALYYYLNGVKDIENQVKLLSDNYLSILIPLVKCHIFIWAPCPVALPYPALPVFSLAAKTASIILI